MPSRPTNAGIAAIVTALALLTACSSFSGGGGQPTLVSPMNGNHFQPNLHTRVYVPATAGVADFYLTDLPKEVLAAGGDLAHAGGTIVHIHLFTEPKAGDTPIAVEATTAIVRVYVLSNGQAGMYGGGGFFSPSGKVKGPRYGGSTRDATLHLTEATPGFEDVLGPSDFSGSFNATLDEAACQRMRLAIEAIEGVMEKIE